MLKLKPILEVINTLLVQQIQVSLASVSDLALGVKTSVSSIELRTEGAEGITLEGLQVAVESLQLPSPADLDLRATVYLEQVDVKIAPAFWPRAAGLAKERLVGNLGLLVDTVELRGVRVQVRLTPDKRLDLRVTMDSCRVKVTGQLMVEVLTLDLEVAGFALKEKDRKKALGEARVRLQDLQVRVLELVMNRVVDVVREKIPTFVSSVDIELNESTLEVKAKTSFLPMKIPVEVRFLTRDNQFGVHIVKVLIGLAKPLVNKAVQKVATNKPGVRSVGDTVWIDPWGRLPLALECRVEKFAVERGALAIGFGSLPEELRLAAPAETEPEPEPPAAELVVD